MGGQVGHTIEARRQQAAWKSRQGGRKARKGSTRAGMSRPRLGSCWVPWMFTVQAAALKVGPQAIGIRS